MWDILELVEGDKPLMALVSCVGYTGSGGGRQTTHGPGELCVMMEHRHWTFQGVGWWGVGASQLLQMECDSDHNQRRHKRDAC